MCEEFSLFQAATLLSYRLSLTYRNFSPPLLVSGELWELLSTAPYTLYNLKASSQSPKHWLPLLKRQPWHDHWQCQDHFFWITAYFQNMKDVPVYQSKGDLSTTYLSIMAHMSMVTLAKLPSSPCSTACKSTSWSSTWILCMHPWKECSNREWSESFICTGSPAEKQNKKHYYPHYYDLSQDIFKGKETQIS